jgi:hypothetical protein
LFYDCGSFNQGLPDLSEVVVLSLNYIQARLVISERVSVYGCLRDKPVGHWKADDTSDEGSAAKKEEVPMETGGLLERKLASLGSQTANVLL